MRQPTLSLLWKARRTEDRPQRGGPSVHRRAESFGASDSRLWLGDLLVLGLSALIQRVLQMDSLGGREWRTGRRKEKRLLLRILWETWEIS